MTPTPPLSCSSLLYLLLPLLFTLQTSLSAPSPRTDPEIWNAAVRKGTVLYRQLQSGCFPDIENPITVPELVASGWALDGTGGSSWPPVIDYWDGFSQFVIQTMGWTDNSDYYVEGISYGDAEEWQHFTSYHNMYSPRNALIAAITTNRLAAEPIHWSDATFAMWAAITAFTDSDITKLRYIGQAAVNNRVTTAIINRAVPVKTQSVTVFRRAGEAFLALLGSPNGAGGVYLLMQHKRALGRKTIVQAVVIRDGRWQNPHLVFEVADLHLPWRTDGRDEALPAGFEGWRAGCGGWNGTRGIE